MFHGSMDDPSKEVPISPAERHRIITERALYNIYMVAKREIARRTPREPELTRATWHNIRAFCEDAGCRSTLLRDDNFEMLNGNEQMGRIDGSTASVNQDKAATVYCGDYKRCNNCGKSPGEHDGMGRCRQ